MLGGEDVSYHVVLPELPILVQEPQHHERAVLFSAVYHAPLNVAIQRIARFSLSQVDPVDSLENAEVPDQAWHRPCKDSVILPDGASVVIHVRPLQATLIT